MNFKMPMIEGGKVVMKSASDLKGEARASDGKWTSGGQTAVTATGRATEASRRTKGHTSEEAVRLSHSIAGRMDRPLSQSEHLDLSKRHRSLAAGHEARADLHQEGEEKKLHQTASKLHQEASLAHMRAANQMIPAEKEKENKSPVIDEMEHHAKKQKEHAAAAISAKASGDSKLATSHAALSEAHGNLVLALGKHAIASVPAK